MLARSPSLSVRTVLGRRRFSKPSSDSEHRGAGQSMSTGAPPRASAKLRLARPDFEVRFPLDAAAEVAEGQRDVRYGKILLRAGAATRETRSTSRREIVTLIFEAAGRALPDWTPLPYPGFPAVFSGGARRVLGLLAYAALPLAFLAGGLFITRRSHAR
jgi:hypothetical protein